MPTRRLIAAMVLLTLPAAAQTIPTPPAPPATGGVPALPTPPAPPASSSASLPTPPAPPGPPASQDASAAPPAVTAAPMPDPLMAPDLQTPSVRTPTLATLVAQSAWQDPVIAAARSQFKQLPENCAAASFKPTGNLVLYAPAQFSTTGTLLSGVWSERITVTGCGNPVSLNVLTVLQPGSPPNRIPTMPGDSHADPTTQKSALEYAQAVAVRASDPGCRQQMFINAKFDGYTGLPNMAITDGRPNRAWREDWSLFACGSRYSIMLTFTPNAQGMQLLATNPIKRN